MSKLYTVLDQTSDEVYYQVGIFETIREAYFSVVDYFEKNPMHQLYGLHYDYDETENINIYEVETGLNREGDLGLKVAEFRRERFYSDDDDEFYLKLVKCSTVEEVMLLTEPTNPDLEI